MICSPESIAATEFSATAYYFGRRLHQALQTPVGMIASSYGGTRIEPWTEAGAATTAIPAAPQGHADDGQKEPQAGGLYNAMIAPLTPYAIRGVIWYQGESNVIGGEQMALYATKMEDLVRSWRQQWGAQLPFYYVQVAPHSYSVIRKARVPDPHTLPELWEAQADARRIPGSAMIVTTDLADDLADIHPRDKTQVGRRLANLALRKTYGQAGAEVDSPSYRGMEIRGATLTLSFDHAAGLRTRDGKPPSHFELAGADGVYHPAQATLRGEQVQLASAAVAAPVAARFAWHEDAQPNLINSAGLPAVPFRTQRPAAPPR
ncbi:sialate O-acetylesterase [Duganella sp. P38]|uniref:sialate O-acetylesterase n=1 Tax=Duganella sp. P38 TaxID=3423949 RepID=UPI003D7B0D03